MNYHFNGAVTERKINLGSAREISSSQLAQQAREGRAIRQEIRLRHAAATKIQSMVRGRKTSQNHRQSLRQRLEGLEASDFIQATKLVSRATYRSSTMKRLNSGGQALCLSKSEQSIFSEDDVLLLQWATRALQQVQDSTPQLLSPLLSLDTASYIISLTSILRSMLCHLRYQGHNAQTSYNPYLEVLLQLMSHTDAPTSTETQHNTNQVLLAQRWASWLVENGLYPSLQAHLLRISPLSKSHSNMLTTSVQLILQPLEIFPLQPDDNSRRLLVLEGIKEDILTITDLSNRISRMGLTQLVVKLPLLELAERIARMPESSIGRTGSVDILANLLAIGWKRIPHFTKGTQVNTYLQALTVLQNNVPSSLLLSAQSTKGKATGRIMPDGIDEEAGQSSIDISPGPRAKVSEATLTRLRILPSQDHISALLTASAKFPSSTRQALCSFLVSTLQSWDALTSDHVLACITYRHHNNGAPTTSKTGAISSHSIEGLVRELWRGWLRGSQLTKFLSTDLLQGRKALLSVLTDGNMETTWPCLVLLCQLYSRSLLTIGDDEFYPPETKFGSTSNSTQSASRNPLSLDEIIAFSGILRNLAFSLYWYEGTGGILDNFDQGTIIGMKKLNLLSLRNTVTRLLQQLHQRDSRRAFAPKDHWLMTRHLDLENFIESVVLEEDELNQYQDVSEESTAPMDIDEQSETMADNRAISRPSISSRIASRRGTNLRRGGYSARNLAYLSPRLGVLNNVPFVIPFEVRAEIFHQFTNLDYRRMKRQGEGRRPRREVTIRRTHIAEDGITQLNALGSDLKYKFTIKFIDQFGIEESGIDGGGLFKEFLTSLVKEAFDTDRGLWSATSDQQLYPTPHSYAKTDESLSWFRFLGRILGKALYHGILVDVNFASFFLSKWLGKGNSYLDDLSGLESLDKEVYRNLLWLKHYTGDIEKDLALDFTVTDEEFGEKHTHELVPNGRDIAVTKENRLEYIYRVSHYRLNEQIRLQSEAFLSGLTDLIDLRWLRMLDREELRILISGSQGEIDLEDLRKNTVLSGYHEKDEIITFFWAALESFSHAQRKAFLKFATSCPSPPLLGFAQLNPLLGIRLAGEDTNRLPTASTCFNLLKLPRYLTYEQCREKLLYAIESGAGFDLS